MNLYHDLYGIKFNQNDYYAAYSSSAYTGLENEISYIKNLKNVKIVNNSWALGNGPSTSNALYSYNFYSRYIDLITANDREMIYVFSAGNNGSSLNQKYRKLSSFQLAYNTIIVGSNNSSGSLSDFSSIGSENTNTPLILANGERFLFKNDLSDGTSFSAPFISGVLANTLIQYREKYKLGINSIIAKAALGVSSLYRNRNQSGLNSQYGTGRLDYKKIKSAFDNLSYIRWTNNRQVLVNNIWRRKNDDNSLTVNKVFLRKGDVLRAGLSWLFNPTQGGVKSRYQKETTYLVNSINYLSENYDLILKKDNKIKFSSETERNYEFIKYTIPEDGFYDLVVSKRNTQLLKPEVELALSWATGKN